MHNNRIDQMRPEENAMVNFVIDMIELCCLICAFRWWRLRKQKDFTTQHWRAAVLCSTSTQRLRVLPVSATTFSWAERYGRAGAVDLCL